MNAPTLIILIVIIVGMAFAGRRMYRVFSLKLTVRVKGMTCEKCVERVQNALNALPGTWARADLATGETRILAKAPIDRDTIERAVEEAGYYVAHR